MKFRERMFAMARKKKLKRTNGSGTVYKLSGNRRKPWVAMKTVGWEENEEKAKQIKKPIGYYETEDAALLALLTHKSVSQQSINEKTTVKELYELIKEEMVKEKKAKSTIEGLTASYKAVSSLENEALYNLTSMDFQDIIDDLIEDSEAKSSFGKLKKIIWFVSKMYDMLIKYKIMSVNHSQFLSVRDAKESEIPPFPEKDIQTLFKNDSNRIAKSSLILAYTGLRISEFLDLKKSVNVDLKKMLIIGGSKTEAGKDRTIPIHSLIQPYVKYFYDEFPDCDYLFSKDNEKVRSKYYRDYYHTPLIKKLKLSDLNPHSFRHTAASKMKIAGVNDKALTEIIGHTEIKFTDKRYITVDDKYLHEEMEKVK